MPPNTQIPIFKRPLILFWIVVIGGLLINNPLTLSVFSIKNPNNPIINEIIVANRQGMVDEDGDHSDWIEIHNPGRQPINLAGWTLTDDPDQPEKWPFPNITLNGQSYLIVFASGKDKKSTRPGAALHTNFKLKQTGEFLGLYNILDRQFTMTIGQGESFPQQFEGVSFGRYGGAGHPDTVSTYGYLTTATPGEPNDTTLLWAGLVAPVSFSVDRGFYEAPFTLELSSPTPGSTIRYTTDGSQPDEENGTPYTEPIEINATTLVRAVAFKPNFRPSSGSTHTYIFLDEVLTQPQDPPGFPKTWGGYEGRPVRADYEMDPEVINDPRYHNLIKPALQSIPTLSIVTNQQSFHDLYANSRRKGRAWERSVSIELIDPQHAQPGFQINAGLRIQGELGRSEIIPKHAFRLFFRQAYGASKLEYPLFPTSSVDQFDTLVLRSGVNRSYAGWPDSTHEITTYTRDEWLRASQLAVSGIGSHGIFVNLYVNGLYWGLYNIVERPDAAFMAAYFGGSEEDWQTISHAETVSNTSERFQTLHRLAAAEGLADPDKYAEIQSYLHIPHFIDYLILNWYAGNLDWGFNNWYATTHTGSEPIRYFVWDGERTWYEGAEIFMALDEYNGQPNLINPLLAALLENSDFRMRLADRLYQHLSGSGALTDANAQARWRQLNRQIELAIIGESARWGDTRRAQPLTQGDWFKARDDVLAQMTGNAEQLFRLAREAGYYPRLDPPLFNHEGGLVSTGFELIMTADEGTIYYTTDGSDPREAQTGQVAATAQVYKTSLPLRGSTAIKARVLSGEEWSALQAADFRVDEPESQLRITEIMYNPPDGDDYEFLELQNGSDQPFDLSGMSLTGIRFTFPAQTSLAPGETLVLVRNPAAFQKRYPSVTFDGVYTGQLSNKGEKITVSDPSGRIFLSLNYDDENNWPISPDGRGDSLVFVDLGEDLDDPLSWKASETIYGSPGE